jgi:hypothetical protein
VIIKSYIKPKDVDETKIKLKNEKLKLNAKNQKRLNKEMSKLSSEPVVKRKSIITPSRVSSLVSIKSYIKPKDSSVISKSSTVSKASSLSSSTVKLSSTTSKISQTSSRITSDIVSRKQSSRLSSNINYYKSTVSQASKSQKTPTINYFKEEKTPSKIFQKKETYTVFLRKKGKFKPIAKDLTKSEALKYGTRATLKDIARTFKIRKTGKTKDVYGIEQLNGYKPKEKIFRTYKVRKGKKIPLMDTYIQKTTANLKSRQEKQQLAEARRLKKLINFKQ